MKLSLKHKTGKDGIWYPYFVWFPVKTEDGYLVWLENIYIYIKTVMKSGLDSDGQGYATYKEDILMAHLGGGCGND